MIKKQIGILKPLQLSSLIFVLYSLRKKNIDIELKGEYIEKRQVFFLRYNKENEKHLEKLKSFFK